MAYDGRPFLAERHLARLQRSADAIDMELDIGALGLADIMAEGLRRTGLQDAMIYIQLSRGVAPRSHAIPQGLTPNLVLTFKPAPVMPADQRDAGVRVMTTREVRWARCFIKAVTLLPNVLARSDARRQGYYDAIFVTEAGEVRESTAANVFVVKAGALYLPPRDESVLHGITQHVILQCAQAQDVPIQEQPFTLDFLHSADEVFLSSTTIEVLGVVAVDDRAVGAGVVGPITRKLHVEYGRQIRQRSAASCAL